MTYLRLPTPTNDVYDWQVDAGSRGMNSSTFFHPWGERGSDRDERAVRAKRSVRAARSSKPADGTR